MALHFDDSASKTDASNSAANNGTAPKLGGKLNVPSAKRAAIIAHRIMDGYNKAAEPAVEA